MVKLKAKDCSPFDDSKQDVSKYLLKLIRKEEKLGADAKNNNFFVLSNRDYDTDDEVIVSLGKDGQWWAGRYVGKCRIDNCEIEIRPRFGQDFLLTMIEEVYNLKLRSSNASNNDETDEWESLVKLALYVIWTAKFAQVNKYGLPRKVVKREYMGNKIKSHLNVRKSLMVMHTKQQLVSEFYERDYDDAICKIVYHAYKILEKISRMPASQTPQLVKESIQQLESQYHAADLTVTPHEYNSIRYKSIYASWKPLVDFSWQIIRQQYGLMASQSDSYAVFIDMAEIWEQYLRKTLADAFKDEGWHCWTVEETKKQVYAGMFYGRMIIPDIVLSRNNECMVFDAKYKKMKGKKEDVDRGDFFQIHSYIHYLQNSGYTVLAGGLLYPIILGNEDKRISDWHSTHLWVARDETDSHTATQFIVDGIVCDEAWGEDGNKLKGKDSLIDEVQLKADGWKTDFINRIKTITNKNIVQQNVG